MMTPIAIDSMSVSMVSATIGALFSFVRHSTSSFPATLTKPLSLGPSTAMISFLSWGWFWKDLGGICSGRGVSQMTGGVCKRQGVLDCTGGGGRRGT